ncbi:MAG: hypothetical protein QXS14_04870 [Desulfurococcaceae archaeon]
MTEDVVSLVKRNLSKAVYEKQGRYTLIVGEFNGVKVVVCLAENYAKVMLEEDVPTLNCREAEYSPAGLYAFSEKPENLASRIAEKISTLVSRKRRLN